MKKLLGFSILIGGLFLVVLSTQKPTSSYQSSIQGMAWVRLAYSFFLQAPESNYLKFKNHSSIKGKLPYLVFPNKESKKWAFYVPGIFSYLDSPFVKYFSSQLHSRGYNVVLVPNSFTSDFLKAKPKFRPGMIEKEAELLCSFINEVREKNNIQQPLELVGVSYGGLLGSAVASQCDNHFKRLTLISPPVDLHHSMNKIFAQLDQTRVEVKNVLSANESLMFAKASLFDPKYFQALFSRFFFDGLYFTLFSYKRFKEGDLSPLWQFEYGSQKYRQWQRKQGLKSFYIEQTEKIYRSNPRQFELNHWLANQKRPFYIFASLDDPINEASQWTQLLENHHEKVFGLSKTGGHLGFIGRKNFEEFLDRRFKGDAK